MSEPRTQKVHIDLCKDCAKMIRKAAKKGGQDNLVAAFKKLTHCPICKERIPHELSYQLNANVLIIPPLPTE